MFLSDLWMCEVISDALYIILAVAGDANWKLAAVHVGGNVRTRGPCMAFATVQDFVRLASWEDRGYYAMRASTEKAQRHLHRLTRNATEVLALAVILFHSKWRRLVST